MPARHDAPAQPAGRPMAARQPGPACVPPMPAEPVRRQPVGDLSFVVALLATGRGGMPVAAPFVATPGGQY